MKNRWWLLPVLLVVLALAGLPQDGPALEFVHLTDTHVLALQGVVPELAARREHFSGSRQALQAFFAAAKKRPPAFFLVTGDLTDAFRFAGAGAEPVYGQVEAFQAVAAASPAPLFLALGNHDIHHYGLNAGKLLADQSVAGEARAAWIQAAPCFRKGTYYSFEDRVGRTRYLFLVLDNGYRDGPLAHEQAAWLSRRLNERGGAVAILAMHVPLGEDSTSMAIKAAAANRGVALAIAGHNHKDGVEEIALGKDTAVQVRTAAFGYGANNWRKLRLREDRIEVFATGKPEQLEKTVPAVGGRASAPAAR